ncbi:uridine kinase [Bacteroidota bacterium]|nr:uridine kinase [Bacteroidota bacterium]
MGLRELEKTSNIEPFVIGLTGLSGAGKTYFVDALKARLADAVTIVGFDDYYKPLEMQHVDEFGEANYDLPSALFSDRFHEDLMSLIAYRPVMIKKYQFENYDAPDRTEIVSPAPILLVEGLFVMDYVAVDTLLDYRIFIDCDLELCFQRRKERDIRDRGIPLQRSLHQWEHHVMPAYNNHILPHKDRCDLVIENNGPAEENVNAIIDHIRSHAHPSVLAAIGGGLT